MLPTQQELRRLFTYDPRTGLLYWRIASGRQPAGAIAGCRAPDGRILVSVDGRLQKAHRVIWKMMTGKEPPHLIDHRDRNGCNNRWSNLRKATKSQNNMNSDTIPRHNTSGIRGVSFFSRTGRYRATIKKDGVSHHLGYFDSPEAAAQAYRAAALRLHGEWVPQ
jgi:hypothetical protein